MRGITRALTLAAATAVVGVLLVAGQAGAVIGGTSDTDNHYANVGVLQLHVGNDWFDFCSGTLVRSDVVLTAAHCTDPTGSARRICASRSTPRGTRRTRPSTTSS
jgi:secreted trypsin-like serine protease